jgi:hypothetical protein
MRMEDREAAQIAQMVYVRALDARPHTSIPLVLYAPLLTASEAAARPLLAQFPTLHDGRPPEEVLADITGYLCDAFLSIAVLNFDPEHYTRWREERPFTAAPGAREEADGGDGDDGAAPTGAEQGTRREDVPDADAAIPEGGDDDARAGAGAGPGDAGRGDADGGKAADVDAGSGAPDGPEAAGGREGESDAAGAPPDGA